MGEISIERLLKDTKRVLVNPFWIPDLKGGESYSRVHDDNDGDVSQALTVFVGKDGDIHVVMPPRVPSVRFRTSGGGGSSPLVRNALMILAWAIWLENKMRQQEVR